LKDQNAPVLGKITLLSGMQPAEEFSTLMHEIAHLCGAEVYVALTSGTRVEACVRRGQAPHNLSLDVHARGNQTRLLPTSKTYVQRLRGLIAPLVVGELATAKKKERAVETVPSNVWSVPSKSLGENDCGVDSEPASMTGNMPMPHSAAGWNAWTRDWESCRIAAFPGCEGKAFSPGEDGRWRGGRDADIGRDE
jgi:hypothetical protein